jgi:hypothetical protein
VCHECDELLTVSDPCSLNCYHRCYFRASHRTCLFTFNCIWSVILKNDVSFNVWGLIISILKKKFNSIVAKRRQTQDNQLQTKITNLPNYYCEINKCLLRPSDFCNVATIPKNPRWQHGRPRSNSYLHLNWTFSEWNCFLQCWRNQIHRSICHKTTISAQLITAMGDEENTYSDTFIVEVPFNVRTCCHVYYVYSSINVKKINMCISKIKNISQEKI